LFDQEGLEISDNIESERTEEPQELVQNEPQEIVLNEAQEMVLNELPILPPRIPKKGCPKGNSKFFIKVYYFTYLNDYIICR